jgi:hypothetical protein
MDISFKIHSPWSIGRKAADTGTVNEFSSRSSILAFHSFVMLGGFAPGGCRRRRQHHQDRRGDQDRGEAMKAAISSINQLPSPQPTNSLIFAASSAVAGL